MDNQATSIVSFVQFVIVLFRQLDNIYDMYVGE